MFSELIQWSTDHYSDLPWRLQRTLYTTLVSEIMLQQTTVSTVLNHFPLFIEKYPTIEDLSLIDEEQILKDWKGLGYYRRARNLLAAAKEIVENYKGEIPLSYDQLISIKGIGPYTANAILGIGADQNVLALDANLERVLARIYGLTAYKGIPLQREINNLFSAGKIATDITTHGGRAYNEALMDLGRSICKANQAYCDLCSLKDKCSALSLGAALNYPFIKETDQKKKSFDLSLLRVVVQRDKEVLSYSKSEKEWLTGQRELPTFVLSTNDEYFRQYGKLKIDHDQLFILPSFKSAITHYKITNYVLFANEKELEVISDENFEWCSIIDGNLSTSSIKAIKL